MRQFMFPGSLKDHNQSMYLSLKTQVFIHRLSSSHVDQQVGHVWKGKSCLVAATASRLPNNVIVEEHVQNRSVCRFAHEACAQCVLGKNADIRNHPDFSLNLDLKSSSDWSKPNTSRYRKKKKKNGLNNCTNTFLGTIFFLIWAVKGKK